MREILMHMLDRSERQQALFLWRLNATRAKASGLAVWAVDQGNRKAYEVERVGRYTTGTALLACHAMRVRCHS